MPHPIQPDFQEHEPGAGHEAHAGSEGTEPARWRTPRAGSSPGHLRALVSLVLARPGHDPRPVVISPGPRWVPEPHAEATLTSVLDADPSLAAAVGWWRWADANEPATVRVGGTAGDDLRLVDLLSRPMSVGPIAVRATSLGALAVLRDVPADAVLDAASSWMIAAVLVGSGVRVGSIPRTCSHRTRTVAEDPEALRPIGLAWLVEFALGRMAPSVPGPEDRRELLARWGAASRVRGAGTEKKPERGVDAP